MPSRALPRRAKPISPFSPNMVRGDPASQRFWPSAPTRANFRDDPFSKPRSFGTPREADLPNHSLTLPPGAKPTASTSDNEPTTHVE